MGLHHSIGLVSIILGLVLKCCLVLILISKLRQSIPEIRQNRRSSTVSASKVLQETCNYIRNLHKEADDLSDRLSQLLETIDPNSPQAAIIRSLINE
ncbi:hypothetical protein BRARA_B00591 [Brassica rapa]|uniref:BHLH domain-containing protein n=1 Tax=Brassica campestris TaxID=3711 RepID=A0A398A8Z4_BRACM|nr:hypothetical protein BRARA_B00591 [Brassica rapa]